MRRYEAVASKFLPALRSFAVLPGGSPYNSEPNKLRRVGVRFRGIEFATVMLLLLLLLLMLLMLLLLLHGAHA